MFKKRFKLLWWMRKTENYVKNSFNSKNKQKNKKTHSATVGSGDSRCCLIRLIQEPR